MLTTHYDREQMEEIQKAARELREDTNVGALLRRLVDQYGNIALSVDRQQAKAYLVEPHIFYPPEFSHGPNALAALTALEQALGQRKVADNPPRCPICGREMHCATRVVPCDRWSCAFEFDDDHKKAPA